jgi:heat shock protein HslJ
MKITMKGLVFSLGLCIGLFVLAGCVPWAAETASSDLTGPLWSLDTINNQPLVPGSGISAQFTSDGKLSGSAGCNQYSGTYSVSGNTMKISSSLATTMMACQQNIMDQENAYLKALGEVKNYTVSGDQLTLSDANNNSLLVYKPQSQNLSGTSWQVIAYNNGKQAVVSVMAGTTLSMEFGKDGTLSGNAGCNTYSGSYAVTGRQIKIGPLASTMMYCGDPAGVMDQETQFLAALQTAATYQLEAETLELRTSDGALALNATTYIPPAASTNSIQGVLWQWVNVTNQATGEKTTVPVPENYTIVFKDDGTFSGKADCNLISGTYSQDNGLVLTLGPGTLMYCGADSLDQDYITLLGSIVAGGPDGQGNLALENAGGEQRMLFKNGGAVQ